MSQTVPYSLMVHGGAGALDNVKDDKTAVRYLESIRRILEHGREILELGGSALQAVEACASLLEDDPVFNAPGCPRAATASSSADSYRGTSLRPLPPARRPLDIPAAPRIPLR